MVAISRLLDKLNPSETNDVPARSNHSFYVYSNLSCLATPTSLSKPNPLTQGIYLNRETGQGALVCLDVTLEDPE